MSSSRSETWLATTYTRGIRIPPFGGVRLHFTLRLPYTYTSSTHTNFLLKLLVLEC